MHIPDVFKMDQFLQAGIQTKSWPINLTHLCLDKDLMESGMRTKIRIVNQCLSILVTVQKISRVCHSKIILFIKDQELIS